MLAAKQRQKGKSKIRWRAGTTARREGMNGYGRQRSLATKIGRCLGGEWRCLDGAQGGQTAGSGMAGGKERRLTVGCGDDDEKIICAYSFVKKQFLRNRSLTSLAVVFSSMVVDNDYQRNFDDLKTTRDGLIRHWNVKEMRVAVSNEIWTESQLMFCRHQIFNMLKICRRTQLIISAVCGR